MPSFWNRDIKTLLPGISIKHKLRSGELAIMCRKLAFMLDAGVTVKSAVLLLAGQADAAIPKSGLHVVHEHILRGESLSDALAAAGVFPELMRHMCRIGEMTAQLPQAMGQLAEYYEQQAKTDDELSAALLYPAVVTLMMLAVISIAIYYVLPGYAAVFASAGASMPMLTRVLIKGADIMTGYGWLIITGLALTAVSWVIFLRRPTGRVVRSWVALYGPFNAVYRQTVNLRFTQIMSLLLGSGQPLTNAVQAAADAIDNLKVRDDLLKLAIGLAAGQSFGWLLTQIPYLDPMLPGLVQVGEETGRLPQTMEKCRQYFQQSSESMIRRLNKLVEPAITIVLGLVLGIVMLSVMLPVFTLTGAF